jgi:hypothetical protein
MFDWLFEGRLAVYVLLGAGAFGWLLLWTRDRKLVWLLGAGAFVGLVGLYFLLDRVVETDREQVTRKLGEMKAAVKARESNRIFAHISDRFRLGGLDKAGFRALVERALSQGLIHELEIWDITDPPDGWPRDGRPARVSFMAKPKGGPVFIRDEHFRVEADFVRDPDGQWRLQGFRLFNPLVDTDKPLPIPEVPP